MSDWMDTAESGWEIDTEERGRIRCPTESNRYWMPNDTDNQIVFLEDRPVVGFWEHSMKIGKSYRNFATCLSHLKMECILCAIDDRASKYKIAPFTIIDRSEFTLKKGDKAGTKVKDSKRLLVAKANTLELIARRTKELEKKGLSLKYAQFNIHRSKDSKSASVGDDFQYDCHVDPADFEDVTPFDYQELFAPNPALVEKYVLQMKSIIDPSDLPESVSPKVEY
tara:strand:- start:148 stop:819 length:672 start_codon:yes stop_codon:yes gene_type:complete